MKKLIATAGIGAALSAGTLLGIGPAHADVFDICPSGNEGVVGGHTSCAFADNVRQAIYTPSDTPWVPPSRTVQNCQDQLALQQILQLPIYSANPDCFGVAARK